MQIYTNIVIPYLHNTKFWVWTALSVCIIFAAGIMAKLSELNTGEKGVIVKIQGHGGFRKRIIEMGFIQGKIVEVLHKAPLQDPVEYQILGYHVSLRLSEASQIEVISVEEAEHLAKEHNPRTGNFMPTCIG